MDSDVAQRFLRSIFIDLPQLVRLESVPIEEVELAEGPDLCLAEVICPEEVMA